MVITVANVLTDMDKMKERADGHRKEVLYINQKIRGLEFNLDSQVEYLSFDRIRDFENKLSDYDAWLIGAHQIEGELCAQIFDL